MPPAGPVVDLPPAGVAAGSLSTKCHLSGASPATTPRPSSLSPTWVSLMSDTPSPSWSFEAWVGVPPGTKLVMSLAP